VSSFFRDQGCYMNKEVAVSNKKQKEEKSGLLSLHVGLFCLGFVLGFFTAIDSSSLKDNYLKG